MKNKIKKFTVNSLFNSIQFNSIPKIVSLIVLLFILLFLVSCSSNEDPNTEKPQQNPEPKYLELAGTWKAYGYAEDYIINIDKDGNFSFNCIIINIVIFN